MSILARYKKPGGFKLLLQLIETSQPAKQAKLLEAINNEDPQWAQLILKKKINSEMVLSWNPDHLATIFENMIPRHCATLLKNWGDAKINEFSQLIQIDKFRMIRDLVENMETPKDFEIVGAQNHLLETVRYLDEEKILAIRYIDPALDLDEAA